MTPGQVRKEIERQKIAWDDVCHGRVAAGVSAPGGHLKLAALVEQWLEGYVDKRLKVTTAADYRRKAGVLCDRLGHIYMDRVTQRHLQGFIDGLSARGLSAATVRTYWAVVTSVMGYAVRTHILSTSPCEGVVLPRAATVERKCYTLEETHVFLAALEDAPLKWKVFFHLAIFTGLRRGELCGLEFGDFDRVSSTVCVRRSSASVRGQGTLTVEPKTQSSARVLGIPEWIGAEVVELQREQAARRLACGDQWHEYGRLFTAADGRPMHTGLPDQWLRGFCGRAGLPYYGLHAMRHLYASLLIHGGASVKTVSGLLGHASPTVTLRVYAHEVADEKLKAQAAVSARLLGVSERGPGYRDAQN